MTQKSVGFFTKVFDVYAEDRNEAESQIEEELEGITRYDVYRDGDWELAEKEVSDVSKA